MAPETQAKTPQKAVFRLSAFTPSPPQCNSACNQVIPKKREQCLPQHELAPPLYRTACVALRALEQACRSDSFDWPKAKFDHGAMTLTPEQRLIRMFHYTPKRFQAFEAMIARGIDHPPCRSEPANFSHKCIMDCPICFLVEDFASKIITRPTSPATKDDESRLLNKFGKIPNHDTQAKRARRRKNQETRMNSPERYARESAAKKAIRDEKLRQQRARQMSNDQ
ncbi:hypothetical protein BJ166DRAFT_615948 [Pestalotiopsis sp. NC0098]|nr:hypothetical protein BJ166DRAFT_615948 [Pestalotiopsis sp. NC0098]